MKRKHWTHRMPRAAAKRALVAILVPFLLLKKRKNGGTYVRTEKITVTEDGRQVEEVHVQGDMYRLKFYPRDTHLAAKIEYCRGGNIPCIPVEKEDEAYITTLTGDMVRCICRGDNKARDEIAKCRTHTSK